MIGNLGHNAFLFAPRAFKQFKPVFNLFQVENHDDFITTEEGRVHIQDQRGYYILYDTALTAFK